MSLNDDQQGALNLHNSARAAVGCNPLVWDFGLQAAAQAWADHMAQTKNFDHDPNAGTGENIFWASPAGPDILRAGTTDWLNEKAQFHGGGFTEATGHYTQCVWDNTTNVGIASNSGYVVARYTPAGNVNGSVAYPMDANGNPTNGGGSGPTQPSGPNGLVCFNLINGSNWKSAVGWYPHIANITGVEPWAIVESPLKTWEGSTQSVQFPNNDFFTFTVNQNAQSQADYSECGSANNNEQPFKVFKGDKKVVFQKDGWSYIGVYYAM